MKKGLNPKTGNGLDDEQFPPLSAVTPSRRRYGAGWQWRPTYMIDSTLNQIELRSVNGRGRMRQRPWHSPVGGEDRIKKNTIERRLLVVPLAGKHPIKAFYSSWPQESTCFWASLALRQTYSIASNRTSRCLALNRKLCASWLNADQESEKKKIHGMSLSQSFQQFYAIAMWLTSMYYLKKRSLTPQKLDHQQPKSINNS